MAGRIIQPAIFHGNTPVVRSLKYATGQTFKTGALLLFDANGELIECSADPATVDAVALENAASKPGFDMANSPIAVTGRVQEVSVCPFAMNQETIFSMRGVNGGTDPVTPAQTNVDESYGVIKHADGEWMLDTAETTALVFRVVDIDIPNKIFFGRILPAVVA